MASSRLPVSTAEALCRQAQLRLDRIELVHTLRMVEGWWMEERANLTAEDTVSIPDAYVAAAALRGRGGPGGAGGRRAMP